MKTRKKIGLTVLTVIIGVGLMMAIQVLTGVKALGWSGAIIAMAMVVALTKIWKSNPDKDKQIFY